MADKSMSGGTWTIKNVDGEVKTACSKAAKKRGLTISAWVNEALRNAAVHDLKGKDESPAIALGDEIVAMREGFAQQQDIIYMGVAEIKALITDQRGKGKVDKPSKADKSKSKGKSKKKKGKK
jgi:hypothetical protein